MKIFITGINGFSGSHISQHLLKQGHEVVATARSPLAEELNSSVAFKGSALSFIQSDLTLFKTLPENLDAIIHIAATSPAPHIKTHDYIHDNILATEHLVDLAKSAKVKKFIFFSSLSVYGDILEAVVNEDTPIINPNAYGMSKALGELCLQDAIPKIASVAFRLPAVLGQGAARHWLANMVQRAKQGEDLKIFNPKAPFNNAVHIKDLCHLIDNLLTMPFEGFNPLTLGADHPLCIEDIVKSVHSAFDSQSKIVVEKIPKPSFSISNQKAKAIFQYVPRTMAEILAEYLTQV